MEGERKPVLLLGTQFNEGQDKFSPDGRWVAYTSAESGRNEIYVRPFVGSGSIGPYLGGGKWQVSKDGGIQAAWRNDSKEIVFFGPNRAAMTVDVSGGGAAFQMGTPKLLFTSPPASGGDVTDDGKRFLLTVEPGQSQKNSATPITVVLNWQADIKL